MNFDTGRDAGPREPDRPGQGGGGPEPGRRLLLAFLLGVLLGAMLVSLFYLTGRFGEIASYLVTGAAAVGAGYAVALVAGRYEVLVAALSPVTGVLLVAVTFYGQATDAGVPLGSSDPVPLLVLGIPLVLLAAAGGWLAEGGRPGSWFRGGRPGPLVALPPLVLVGLVAVVLAVLGLFAFAAGVFEESPSEALESAYRAANEGDYETANGYLSSRILNGIEEGAPPPSAVQLEEFWDATTQNGTVTRISVYDEEVRGREAKAEIGLSFEEGGASGTVVGLIREDDGWKLAPGEAPRSP